MYRACYRYAINAVRVHGTWLTFGIIVIKSVHARTVDEGGRADVGKHAVVTAVISRVVEAIVVGSAE
jgi:putative component of membrane protein insertase Oxa1/YidC/SpoIIIJ protein YidD